MLYSPAQNRMPTRLPDCDSHCPALLDFFLPFVLQWLSLHWEFLILWLSQFPSLKTGCNVSSHNLSILVLIGMVFVVIREMFHGKISLNSMLLLLLVNFVIGFRFELMYISLIVNIRSRLTHLHRFEPLVLLP